jgi:membrane-associated phospholipid phosphatase
MLTSLLAVSFASPARADSPYTLRAELDLPAYGIAAGLAMLAFVESPDAACLPDCSSEDINALDAWVLGFHDETVHTVADIWVLTMVGLPFVLDLAVSELDGWFEDAVVMLEALLVAQALTQLTKVAAGRYAPFVYDPTVPDEVRRNADSTRSFFSGHTTTAFTMASAFTTTFFLRHPESPWRWVVLGASAALASTVGVLKIFAGYHFLTDILAGALVGTAVGALVPILHSEL